MSATTKPVAIGKIRRDGGTQARVGNNEETVEQYAELMRDGRWEWNDSNLVIVFRDEAGENWLGDGFHRVEAATRAGWPDVLCSVRDGSRRDAVLFAAGANALHGLRRTRADVRRSIEVLLRDPEWAKWSDREIARRVHCDHKTVAAVRADLSGEIPQMGDRTVTRNGTTYTQAPAARPVAAPSPYHDMIRSATSIPGLQSLRLDIAADKRVPDPEMQVYMRMIDEQIARLSAAPAAPAPAAPAAPAAWTCAACGRPQPAPGRGYVIPANLKCTSCAMEHDAQRRASLVTIDTEEGPRHMAAIRRSDAIALVALNGTYTVTHISTGRAVGLPIGSRTDAESRFDQLATLDWSQMSGDILPDDLRGQIMEICGMTGPDDQRKRQLVARAAAMGCSTVTTSKGINLLRGGVTVAGIGSHSLDSLEELIGTLERAGQDDGRINDLVARAAACGYQVRANGAGWRLSRDGTPMGGVKHLDELESCIQAWEQRRAADSADSTPAPPALPERRGGQLAHAESMLAGLIAKLAPDETRLLHCLIYGEALGEDEDIDEEIWNGGKNTIHELTAAGLAWLIGAAAPAAVAA